MKTFLLLVAASFVFAQLYAQDSLTKGVNLPFKFTVEPAPEWTNLFYRDSGWFGADGIFSIPLSGVDKNNNEGNDSTLLLFGDTYIGKVEDGKPLPGNVMVNNTVAYITGNDPDASKLHFYYKQSSNGKPETFFIPQTTTAQKPQYFWLGDGFVNKELQNTTYIFAYKIEKTGEGVFDFIEPDVSIIALPKGSIPPFENQRQIETPFHFNVPAYGEGNLGGGILVNTEWSGAPNPDGYIYVYGVIGKDKNLIVSRVQPKDFENLTAWKFWDGNGWNSDMNKVSPVTNSVSNELSVTPLENGKFLLVFQVLGLSEKVGMRFGESPVGPFSDIVETWKTPEMDSGLFTYNAKAHFNLSKPNELLISYNTITPDFWNDIQKDAHIYRPRFIKLKFQPL